MVKYVNKTRFSAFSWVEPGRCYDMYMNIFPRKSKKTAESYYFGEFEDAPLAPFSISLATLNDDYTPEQPHYHSHNQKAYVTLEGEGALNINGESVAMTPDSMIQVEPNEVHFVERVVRAPLKFIVVLASKTNDKHIIETN